jgi:DNA-binding response OmpR family regulator/DNA-binding CsgD family transcriptional regulator
MKRRDTVLVVDDLPGTLGLLNEALEAAGYTVLLALSASFALSVIERITPDIILIDAIMPGMDGFELCRIMKRNAALAAVPIIFMTGLTESEHVVRGFEAGGVDYVTKPVAPGEVIARIGVHLVHARRTRSAQMALDAAGRFLFATAPDGRVLWATPQAAALLHDAAAAMPGRVLEELYAWGADWTINPADLVPGRCVASLTHDRHTLEFHFVGQFGPDEMLLRVVAANTSSGPALLQQRLGLTAREAEVLLWISRGKSNRDIGDILGLRPSTVTKHLEQIYIKLGVENRASAAAIAVRIATAEAGGA